MKIKIFIFLLFLPIVAYAYVSEITKTVTVGSSFTISPWSERGSGFSGYECTNTYITGDVSDFTINETSRTSTSYTSPNGIQHGYYATYSIQANKTGTYTLYAGSNCIKSTAGGWVYGNPVVKYYIIVSSPVPVSSISLNTMNAEITIGENLQLEKTIIPSNASNKSVIWSTSNEAVAIVDNNGLVTGVGIGTANITCTATNGVSTHCIVTVNPVLVNGITFNQAEAELTAGEKLQLEATIAPDNASDKSITWSSTNEAVAVVSESGLVTAVGSGTCLVKATANDGSGKSASCLVTVLGNVMFCEDFGAVPSATVTLPIQLTNAEAIQGFEFKLVLPEGVSVQADGDGKLLATLTDRVSTQGLEGANQGNGIYQFVFTSTARIQGNSGAVVNIPIVVADNVAVGQYDVIVKDVELVKYGSSSQIHHSDRTATLTIKEMTLGDVNGDGRISVADAISIINYVLGRTPVSFILVAADVNGDNDITLADAVATVDKILAGGNAGARAAIRNIMSLDPQ